jgi:hypothetical protein
MLRPIKISKIDIALETLRKILKANHDWLISLLGAFLVGWLASVLSNTGVTSWRDVWAIMFDPRRPLNLLSWFALLIIVGIPAMLSYLERRRLIRKPAESLEGEQLGHISRECR